MVEQRRIVLIAGIWSYVTIAVLAISFCYVGMILRGVYSVENPRMRRMMGLLGVCGTASLLLGLWETAIQGEPIVADGMLLKNGAMLLYAVIWVAVALLFFVKERRQKAKCNEE